MLTPTYMFLAVVLVLLILLIVFRRNVSEWLKSGQKNHDQKAECQRMAEIIHSLSQKDPKWKRLWPTAGRLHLYINTKVPEKDRSSNANVRDQVAKRYGLTLETTKSMLRYYRGIYLKEAHRLYEFEKRKQAARERKGKGKKSK
ncbi:hypothetical protein HN858_05520 [Candidatus Falkowbacteria bacterium]|jgi:hypothetical protein|nr:hypothetical protein [Candidatus Falkowbacteria bacterium]MBT5502917.1 hypothetical protein [Candidatus Falkowbacteria bacterium]MBT6573719.1 hypothetical protein [Candidatus Falkowbacteria bacterium]MBT7349095.1 hypothetical protein [Candidatus Falkowbacteria bacterium]MBT7500046.1 hypothetical protein [Candidatus Falkowbacteria bacterium]